MTLLQHMRLQGREGLGQPTAAFAAAAERMGAINMSKPSFGNRQECTHEVGMRSLIKQHGTERLFLHVLEAGLTLSIPIWRFLGQVFVGHAP